jgi:hypothetical protein
MTMEHNPPERAHERNDENVTVPKLKHYHISEEEEVEVKNFDAEKDDDVDLEAKRSHATWKQDDLKKYHSSVMTTSVEEVQQSRDLFLVWMCYGFVSGLFLPNSDALDPATDVSRDYPWSLVDREAYREELLNLFQLPLLEPASPQEQAIQWMSFQDDIWTVPATAGNESISAAYHRTRLEQRYALAVWYFAQGGPKLWSSVHHDDTGGWINHGAGVHECDWMGVDCEVMASGDDDDDARVVTGIRLNAGTGVVLTGTSLSTELGMLTNVRRLDFNAQRLEGSIPDEWKAMTNLGEYILFREK